MAFAERGLKRIDSGGVAANASRAVSIWHYVSDDAAATVDAGNYFDAHAAHFAVGDIIMATLDVDGTATLKNYVVTAATSTAVTIAAQTVA